MANIFAEVLKSFCTGWFCLVFGDCWLGFTLYPFQTEAGSGYCLWKYRRGAFIKKRGPVLHFSSACS